MNHDGEEDWKEDDEGKKGKEKLMHHLFSVGTIPFLYRHEESHLTPKEIHAQLQVPPL